MPRLDRGYGKLVLNIVFEIPSPTTKGHINVSYDRGGEIAGVSNKWDRSAAWCCVVGVSNDSLPLVLSAV